MNVLFVCIQNAGRSQIAQALFERAAAGRHQACSAGSRPAQHVHPEVVEVMREIGIDLESHKPHRLDQADMEWADVVVTMGCGDECPYIPGKRYIDWELLDPAGQPPDVVRGIRDEIGRRVADLLDQQLSQPFGTSEEFRRPAGGWLSARLRVLRMRLSRSVRRRLQAARRRPNGWLQPRQRSNPPAQTSRAGPVRESSGHRS
jgi:arsenate reductase (thioredoxin)